MAISKMQPMRPYLKAVGESIDTANDDITTLQEQGNIFATALSDLQDAIGNGFSATTTVTGVTGALSSALQSISDELGSGFDKDNTVAEAISQLNAMDVVLNAFATKFRIGMTDSITVDGNASQSTSETFDSPFGEESKCIVIPMVVTDELLTFFELTIIDCTYSGFNFSVHNNDADEHTVNVGYVAIEVG